MTSIHNDDVKCFHVVVQETHKLVVMGHINLKDHMLIKRQWVGKKWMQWAWYSRTKKNKVTIKSGLCLLLEVVFVFKVLEFIIAWCRKCHWKTTENSKGKGSAKEWTQTKTRRRNRIIKKNKTKRGVEKSIKRRHVEYSIIGYKVIVTFINIFWMCRREGI